jgi:hypothetical protein
MRNLYIAIILILFAALPSSAQDLNKIVFGPLEGDDAGVLTVLNEQAIEIEMWVRTDPDNPAPITGVSHCLMSADSIIAGRDGATFDPDYNLPCWDTLVTAPIGHDDDPGIPEGHTIQTAIALSPIFDPPCDGLDTNGEWDYFGSFLMTCNSDVPVEETYYPFSAGGFPHSGQGTSWSFDNPPGGSIIPDQDFCGLYFAPECEYIPGDCNCNGIPVELSDAVSMIGQYRGSVGPCYTCFCPPHGEHFAANADPDGNCIPFEISDVVIMLNWPHWPPFGCPDCPAWDRLDDGKAAKSRVAPTLKSKAKIRNKQMQEEGLK